ncbi:MAG: biotin--[acetyl-CoA-carboxylase] ligase [Alphaproteobacteria bacterium]
MTDCLPKIEYVESIGSTNSYLMDQIRHGQHYPNFYGLRAGLQTAGRGRMGRVWHSAQDHSAQAAKLNADLLKADGNLYLSLIYRPDPADIARLGQLSLVAGLALYQALKKIAQDDQISLDLSLKWPNDLLSNGAKLSGILIETISDQAGILSAIIGTGLNIAHHPANQNLLYPTTSLYQAGFSAYANLAGKIADSYRLHFIGLIDKWQQAGFNSLKLEWCAATAMRGSPIKIRDGDQLFQGYFYDLDDDGALLLSDDPVGLSDKLPRPSGLRRFYCGDIVQNRA